MSVNLGIADGTPGYSWDAESSIPSTGVQNGMDVVGSAVTEPLATTGDVTTYMWHISPFCKNPEAAMRVLNVLFTDPKQLRLQQTGWKDWNMNLTKMVR